MKRTCLSIILAAGEGTRMQSSLPKVLHEIAGLPLVGHVAKTLHTVGVEQTALIVGRGADSVETEVKTILPHVSVFQQTERLGTAHAVLTARQALQKPFDDILIIFGDTPLIESQSLQKIKDSLADGADLVITGFETKNPTGYGRLIEQDGKITSIVEEKEATPQQKDITFCNGGLMGVSGHHALQLLERVKNDNTKGEFYLTDIVKLASAQRLDVRAVAVAADNVMGVNTRLELAEAEQLWQQKKRRSLMLSGVTMQMPESVYLTHDTIIEKDVVIEPNVYFGKNVKIASNVTIHAFSHLEGAQVGSGCHVGPHARLRPGTMLAANAKVGNFCEIKNAKIGPQTKINHLTYIGDAEIGARTNVGAGTITCNYDGFDKWQTTIGNDVFIGSHSVLNAPLTIDHGAFIASGSVVTKNVPENALAIGRSRQENKESYAKLLRQRHTTIKAIKN